MDMLTQLGFIFLASVVFILLALRLRMPAVLGFLVAGAIIGPHGLGLVQANEFIDVFAQIGTILLLFFVGVELSINKIAEVWMRSLLIWFFKDGFVFVIVYEITLLFGLDFLQALVLASALCISSTTFFIKLSQQKEMKENKEVGVMFVVLIIEDLVAVFLLAIYSGLAIGDGVGFESALFAFIRAILVIFITYIALQNIIKGAFERLSRYNSDELMLFLSLSTAILFSAFASFIGLTPAVGAFLAGSILSSVGEFKRTEDSLSRFGMLFSSFFFLSIGMLVDVNSMLQNIGIIVALFIGVTLSSFVSIFSSTYIMGSRGKNAVLSGILMLTVGEFSLIIAGATKSLVAPFDIVSVSAALVFLTALNAGIAVQYRELIDSKLTEIIPPHIKENAKRFSVYFSTVIAEFDVNGSVHNTLAKGIKEIVINLAFSFLIIFFSIFISVVAHRISFPFAQYSFVLMLPAIYPIAMIIRQLRLQFEAVAKAFNKLFEENYELCDVAARDIEIAFSMILFAFAIPFIVALLRLPKPFGFFFVVPLGISLLFVWNIVSVYKKLGKNAKTCKITRFEKNRK